MITVHKGDRFGEWEVLETSSNKMVPCKCSCGETFSVQKLHLVHGRSTKCFPCARVRHGLSYTPEYSAVHSMKHDGKIPKDWDTVDILLDLGSKPDGDYCIGAIDPKKPITKGNITWVTRGVCNSRRRFHNRRPIGATHITSAQERVLRIMKKRGSAGMLAREVGELYGHSGKNAVKNGCNAIKRLKDRGFCEPSHRRGWIVITDLGIRAVNDRENRR